MAWLIDPIIIWLLVKLVQAKTLAVWIKVVIGIALAVLGTALNFIVFFGALSSHDD